MGDDEEELREVIKGAEKELKTEAILIKEDYDYEEFEKETETELNKIREENKKEVIKNE